MFVSTLWSVGSQVTSFLYPSLYVIFVGKSVSANVAFGLAYVVLPLVFILTMPSPALKITVILSLGRSSFCGAFGSVLFGSTTTTCSLTINICLSTSNEEPSSKVSFSLPSNFPAFAEFLFDKSVTVASSISALTAVELLSSAGCTPSFQSIVSAFQTFIVFGFSPPSSLSWSAFDKVKTICEPSFNEFVMLSLNSLLSRVISPLSCPLTLYFIASVKLFSSCVVALPFPGIPCAMLYFVFWVGRGMLKSAPASFTPSAVILTSVVAGSLSAARFCPCESW